MKKSVGRRLAEKAICDRSDPVEEYKQLTSSGLLMRDETRAAAEFQAIVTSQLLRFGWTRVDLVHCYMTHKSRVVCQVKGIYPRLCEVSAYSAVPLDGGGSYYRLECLAAVFDYLLRQDRLDVPPDYLDEQLEPDDVKILHRGMLRGIFREDVSRETSVVK